MHCATNRRLPKTLSIFCSFLRICLTVSIILSPVSLCTYKSWCLVLIFRHCINLPYRPTFRLFSSLFYHQSSLQCYLQSVNLESIYWMPFNAWKTPLFNSVAFSSCSETLTTGRFFTFLLSSVTSVQLASSESVWLTIPFLALLSHLKIQLHLLPLISPSIIPA